MITIGFSTREIDNDFIKHLKTSCGLKNVEIIPFENKGSHSLTEVYNTLLAKASNDIVVLCHDDIIFETKNWGRKLLKHFKRNNEYGILGVAGSKYMPISGRWWEKPQEMIGIVNHQKDGNKWESKYSENLGNKINDTLCVDGLFIAINKLNIKHPFNEDIKGFHFYDIDFSFNNFLSDVKVGVIFDIRLTHLSIGETNEQWENNREQFVNLYKDNLPKKVKRNLNINSKIKVLISCLSFKNYTGSELYVFELAKNLVKMNCEVTIVSDINGVLSRDANKFGIKTLPFTEYPSYKLGDGKWSLSMPDGTTEVSKENNWYKVGNFDYDIIHVQHTPITKNVLKLYPDTPKISTIHSEVIPLEEPVIDNSIKKYISIRSEIKEHLIKNHSIDESQIEVIYNPINENKFNTKNAKNKEYILFVGTIDYLRKNTIFDIAQYAKDKNKKLFLVGKNQDSYLDDLLSTFSNVKYFEPTNRIEEFVKNSEETAGILLGRTTIESWMCGKPSWIYDIDDKGNILSKKLHNPPSDINKYNGSTVAKLIKEEYINVLNND